MESPSTMESPTARFPLTLRYASIIAVAAIVLALPMLLYGPMPGSWDSYQHLNYAHHFSDQFWAGEWYPRWLKEMNHGLGSPTMFVYPPLPSYVYALLAPAQGFRHFDAFKMGEFLALFGSGIFAFLWMSTMTSPTIALLSSILYMLMPYHLAIDYYHRSALSESWGLVWMPAVLYFAAKALKGSSVWLVGLGCAYAMLIMSHMITALLFSLIPLALAAFSSPQGARVKSTVRAAAGMLLGAGLSSFYWISAFAQAKYFPVSRLPLWGKLDHHLLLRPANLLHGSGMIRKGALSAACMFAVCLMCCAIILAKGSRDSRKKVYFWLAISILSVWMMSPLSAPVWRLCPPLHAAVQYPGRFTLVLCLALLPVLGIFLSEITRMPLVLRGTMAVLLLAGIIPWLIAYRGVWESYAAERQTPLHNPSVSDYDGWFLAWPVRGLDDASALQATKEPPARFVTGTGTARLVVWKPRQIDVETDSPGGGEVVINQFYYPAWVAVRADGRRAITVEPAMPQGLLKLDVPPGHQQIRLEIPVGLSEHLGWWISGLSVLLSLTLVTRFGFLPMLSRRPVFLATEAR